MVLLVAAVLLVVVKKDAIIIEVEGKMIFLRLDIDLSLSELLLTCYPKQLEMHKSRCGLAGP